MYGQDGSKTVDYGTLSSVALSAIKQLGGAIDVVDALSATSTLRSFYQATTTPAITIDAAGHVRLSGYGAGTLATDADGNIILAPTTDATSTPDSPGD